MPDTNARKESNKFAEDCLGYISAVMLLASSIPLFIWFFLMLGSLSGGYSLPRTLGEVFLTLFSMLFVPIYLSLSLYVSLSVKTKRNQRQDQAKTDGLSTCIKSAAGYIHYLYRHSDT